MESSDELYDAYEKAWKAWHKVIEDLEYERNHLPLSMSNSQRKKRKAEIFNELKNYKENVRPPRTPKNDNQSAVKTANLMSILALAGSIK